MLRTHLKISVQNCLLPPCDHPEIASRKSTWAAPSPRDRNEFCIVIIMPVYLVPFPSHVATYWWKRTTFLRYQPIFGRSSWNLYSLNVADLISFCFSTGGRSMTNGRTDGRQSSLHYQQWKAYCGTASPTDRAMQGRGPSWTHCFKLFFSARSFVTNLSCFVTFYFFGERSTDLWRTDCTFNRELIRRSGRENDRRPTSAVFSTGVVWGQNSKFRRCALCSSVAQ